MLGFGAIGRRAQNIEVESAAIAPDIDISIIVLRPLADLVRTNQHFAVAGS